MIGRAGVTIGAVAPVAGALAQGGGATVQTSQPIIWHFLGYPFEAGSMIAGLCACIAVRFYVSQTDRQTHRWTVDVPVSALTLMFTAGAIASQRPAPLTALMLGTGMGALGAGIISIAMKWVRRMIDPVAVDEKGGGAA